MEGTRLNILKWLQREGASSVDALARNMGLAPATIRRHLDILQRDHLVDFEEVRKKTGRPEYSFYLTEDGHEALPKAYDRMLGLMVGEVADLSVDDLGQCDGSQLLDLVFGRLSARITRENENKLVGKGLGERLKVLESVLDAERFHPEVVREGKAVRINLLNCPFRSVALKNEAVCRFDKEIIETTLGVSAVKARSLNDGSPGCSYVANLSEDQLRELSEQLDQVESNAVRT